MSELFKQTVGRLPDILVRNARSMMHRMLVSMQTAIAEDRKIADASYCVVLLKMTADDLAAGFEQCVRESMDVLHSGAAGPDFSATGFTLAIEPVEDDVSSERTDFEAASLAFASLLAKGQALGVPGLRNYGRGVLYTCLRQALERSRMSPQEVAKVLPYARRALNHELVRLYAKLEAL